MLQIACSHLHHQRVVCLISFVFPFTLAYIFGFVCLFETTICLKSPFSLIFIYEMLQIAVSYLHHQRVVFLLSLAFPFTLAYRFGFVCVFLNLRFFSNLIFPLIFIYGMRQIAGSHLHHQRVVFLISFAFPSTLAYTFGFVCLF